MLLTVTRDEYADLIEPSVGLSSEFSNTIL